MPQTIDVETRKHGQQYAWSEKEMRSLVEFVALYWDHADKSTHWPKHRVKEFWGKCAIYVAESSKKVKRTWEAMRSKVIKNLSTKFSMIDEAEEFYKLDYINDSHNDTGGSGQSCMQHQQNPPHYAVQL